MVDNVVYLPARGDAQALDWKAPQNRARMLCMRTVHLGNVMLVAAVSALERLS